MVHPNKAAQEAIERSSSLGRDAWHRLLKNKLAVASMVILTIMFVLCFVVAWFLKDPDAVDHSNKFASPSFAHPLGTEQLGRDVLSRILYGGQISILVALVATAVSVVIGIVYGAISGFVGGRIDALMMRIVDTLYAIPFLVLVILLQAVLDAYATESVGWIVENTGWDKNLVGRFANIVPLFIALGILGWLTLARITRTQVQALKKQEFVEAAVSLGLSPFRILFRHIVPNTIGPAIVYSTLTIPGFILTEAALSYLGLGVKAPNSSWGILIKEGANFLETQPMLLIMPSIFFSATLFALNFLGDGLRDALDVRSSKD
ncbi:MAG: ABC transporter permease [Verrucomicrobiales bacterium]|nr:ABC transporter permease [Verrucomicrobiae bacterium]